ncbi:ribonuclease E/G [Seohaeicola nanhaiensis]|uniref:Ribonuclease E n=1 Tax=Seohaeicola nanhaiensis TaxID=1387282 RepID=A0ABV9KKB3_9RHOB
MAKKMLIDATHAEETRVVVVDGNKVEEFDFESENKRQLAGNIYLAKVTRVEPSLQAAFVDYGGNRHGFLAFSEIHPDYYQIPIADRKALMEEEQAYAEAQHAREEEEGARAARRGSRRSSAAESTGGQDAVTEITGMQTIDFSDEGEGEVPEGSSPMERVPETPVAEPEDDHDHDHDGEAGDVAENDAAARDDTIESVAVEDDVEDLRPQRRPRPRRYKIQEVIKVRQVLLVQVVKEERGNKGAALTTYLSLAGRYCVLMPNTARGGGISRKITNAVDRKKLKEIAGEIDVPPGAGLIVRTAGAKRTKAEIKRDYEYLQRLWEQIRDLTLKSIAPAKIYEEGDLIKRSIRDLYSRDIDEVLVEGDRGYRIAKDFMKMIMPSHAKNVKPYAENLPLFARFQVESYLAGMFNPTVQLKSGGYIVIGVTEALVAIDVNSGRATKEGSIEETALKTNMEAAEEVARQLRLRDLAGLIVIDFIDMDERKNNAAVEKKLKDKLKTDRARIQVGRISGFGLLEMSRQRLRPGMLEATTQPCTACHGTGLIRSDDSLALSVLRQIEEEGTRNRSREVLVKCPVAIANFLMNQKREHIAQIETRYGMAVRIEGDVHLVSPDVTMEKFKTATRAIPVQVAPVISVDTSLMDQVDADEEDIADEEEDEIEAVAEATPEQSSGDGESKPKRKRRRRRRRSGKSSNGDNGQEANGASDEGDDADEAPEAAAETVEAAPEVVADADAAPVAEEAAEPAPKKKATRSRSRKKAEPKTEEAKAEEPVAEAAEPEAEPAPKKTRVSRSSSSRASSSRRKSAAAEPEVSAEPVAEAVAAEVAPEAVPDVAPVAETPVAEAPAETPVAEAPVAETPAEPEAPPAKEPEMTAEAESEDSKPKRRGWWSLGSR